jgi:O-antigen/teichoic acid export membrane protein
MTRILEPTELATYRQSVMAFDIALPFLSFNLATAVFYFLPTENKRSRGLFLDGIFILVTMGILYNLFIIMGGNRLIANRFSNPELSRNLLYISPLSLAFLPATLTDAVLVTQNRIRTQFTLCFLSNILMATGLLAACLIWASPEAVLKTRCLIGVITGIVSIAISWQTLPRDNWMPKFANIKTMLRFSLPLAVAGGIGALSVQTDKILVAAFCSPKDFAIYSTGAIDIPFASIITAAAMTAIYPELRRLIAIGDRKAAVRLFSLAACRTSVFLFPLAAFLFVAAEPFMELLFSATYVESALPFRLYLLRIPMKIVIFATLMTSLGLNRTILLRTLLAFLTTACIGFVLVPALGPNGAIIGGILSLYLIEGVWCVSSIAREAGCNWSEVLPFRQMATIMFISVVAGCATATLLPLVISWLGSAGGLSLAGLTYLASYLGTAYGLGVTPIQKELANARSTLGLVFRTKS